MFDMEIIRRIQAARKANVETWVETFLGDGGDVNYIDTYDKNAAQDFVESLSPEQMTDILCHLVVLLQLEREDNNQAVDKNDRLTSEN